MYQFKVDSKSIVYDLFTNLNNSSCKERKLLKKSILGSRYTALVKDLIRGDFARTERRGAKDERPVTSNEQRVTIFSILCVRFYELTKVKEQNDVEVLDADLRILLQTLPHRL